MAQAWTERQRNAELAALSFDERLGLLVDAEWLARENKRLARTLQEAKLKLPQLIGRPASLRSDHDAPI